MNRSTVFFLGFSVLLSLAGFTMGCAAHSHGSWAAFFAYAADLNMSCVGLLPGLVLLVLFFFSGGFNGGGGDYERHHYDSPRTINPANGLPMMGSVDTHGNAYGSDNPYQP